MADTEMIDLETTPPPLPPPPQYPTPTLPKSNPRKRKRKETPTLWQNPKSPKEKQVQIETLEKELGGLFAYYKVATGPRVVVDLRQCGGSRNAVVAALMEESDLPLSSLVDEIHAKLNSEVAETVTAASVKNSVLNIGQRMMYGVSNDDADILEDHSASCLWCWETRDVNLLPKSVRGELTFRRTCRKMIHERITAVSEIIVSLKQLESEPNYNQNLMKASKKLSKSYTEAEIHVLIEGLLKKNSEDMDKKKAKQEQKLLVKQLDRNRREAEKEKESTQCELQTETHLNESDLILLQGKAKNAEKCQQRKQQKKQGDKAEKDQRRREKEEAELKKKRSTQKQISIMERFLNINKPSLSVQKDKVSTEPTASDLSSCKSAIVSKSVTLSMDKVLASSSHVTLEDLCESHFSSWRCLGQSIRSKRKQRWGLRQNPKVEAFNKLKLTATKAVDHDGEVGMEKHVDRLGESCPDISSCSPNADSTHLDAKKYHRGRQLFQFDKAHRPAFYGFWPTKSHVGPRHPLSKDPSLDYDVSSDEEWEEEEPGESLSGCDKDEEECQEECSKSDGESEDGFFVPDGYLSEDEGAQVDTKETDINIEGTDSAPGSKNDIVTEEFCALLRQQKYLNKLTEFALRKNHPLIIPNFVHDNEFLLLGHNISCPPKQEQICLQALSMYIIPGSSHIELSIDEKQDEDKEACLSIGKDGGATPLPDLTAIPDSDLHKIVTTIQNCSKGMNKVLGSLQQQFPSASKSLLRNKVREVSVYVDNRWQVKKEALVKFGLPVNPDDGVKPGETSPMQTLKSCTSTTHE